MKKVAKGLYIFHLILIVIIHYNLSLVYLVPALLMFGLIWYFLIRNDKIDSLIFSISYLLSWGFLIWLLEFNKFYESECLLDMKNYFGLETETEEFFLFQMALYLMIMIPIITFLCYLILITIKKLKNTHVE